MGICHRLKFLDKSVHRITLLALMCLTMVVGAPVAQPAPNRIVDFGVVGTDFKVYHTFTYQNSTPKQVVIKPKNVPCECSTVRIADSLVKPGESTSVRLEFDTKNVFGPTAKQFTISTTDPAAPVVEYHYVSNVGQWLLGIRPEPPSAFFLPAHKSKRLTIANPRASKLEFELVDQADTFFDVEILKGKLSKGDIGELEVTPAASLTKGTYFSSFRLRMTPSEGAPPFFLTIPVKIVRY